MEGTMTKYIDAERLKEKIYAEDTVSLAHGSLPEFDQGCHHAFLTVLSFIDSFQQEQGLIIIKKKDWEAQEQFRKNKDFGKPLQHEQQEVDLDADIEMEWDSFNKHLAKYGEESEDVVWLNWNSFDEITHHFYELGLKARK